MRAGVVLNGQLPPAAPPVTAVRAAPAAGGEAAAAGKGPPAPLRARQWPQEWARGGRPLPFSGKEQKVLGETFGRGVGLRCPGMAGCDGSFQLVTSKRFRGQGLSFFQTYILPSAWVEFLGNAFANLCYPQKNKVVF